MMGVALASRPLLVATLATLAIPAAARADLPGKKPSPALSYGFAAFELGAAASLAIQLRPGDLGTPSKIALNVAPFALAAGFGYLADRSDWSHRPAFAAHGALFAGGALYLAGALAAGDHDDPLRHGPLAYGLGAAGIVGGAWLGAALIDDDGDVFGWVAGSWTGFLTGVLGGLLVGVPQLIQSDTNGFLRVWGTSVVMGTLGGVVLGAVIASTDDDTPRVAGASLLAPVGISLSGRF